MLIIYTLGVMWAVGLLGVTIFLAVELFDSIIGRVVYALIATPLWVLMGLGPLALIEHENGPELARLLESEWQCSQSHESTSIIYVKVGSAMVPQPITTTVCDVYIRK